MNNTLVKKKFDTNKFVTVIGILGVVAIVTALLAFVFTSAFAAEELESHVKGALTAVLGTVQSIANIVGIVCVAICGLILVFTKEQKASDGALTWLKRILLALVLINLAEPVVNYATELATKTAS